MRTIFVIAATLVVVGGYAASQWAFFRGDPAQYAKSVDAPPMWAISGLLLFGAIILGFLGGDRQGTRTSPPGPLSTGAERGSQDKGEPS